MTAKPIRIVIADAQKLMRQGLCRLFEQESGIQVVGEASTATEVYKLNRIHQPDLVLLDIAIDGQASTAAITTLIAHRPATRVLVLTAVEDDQLAVQAFEAGAVGYLLKDCTFPDLLKAVHSSLQGDTPLHPRIARMVLRWIRQPAKPVPDPMLRLTAREREVLNLLAQGRTNSEIAQELVITQFTVRSHVCRVLKKLKLANRTQAALYLLKHQSLGLV